MPRIGERFSFDLTWRQELGLDSVIDSTHDWFQREIEELVQSVVKLDRKSEDYHVKRIIEEIDKLELARLEATRLREKMLEIEKKFKSLSKEVSELIHDTATKP